MLAIIKFFSYWSVFFLWVAAFSLLIMDNFAAHLRLTELRPPEIGQSDFIRYFGVIFAMLWLAYFATNLMAYGRLMRPRKKKDNSASPRAGAPKNPSTKADSSPRKPDAKVDSVQNEQPGPQGDEKSPNVDFPGPTETSK